MNLSLIYTVLVKQNQIQLRLIQFLRIVSGIRNPKTKEVKMKNDKNLTLPFARVNKTLIWIEIEEKKQSKYINTIRKRHNSITQTIANICALQNSCAYGYNHHQSLELDEETEDAKCKHKVGL